MSKKVQFMVLVDEETRDRMDALRVVLRESRARVGEDLLLEGLQIAELRHVARLERLHRVAEKARRRKGYGWRDFVREFATRYARQYGPTLEELESDPKQGLTEVSPAA